jgi:hypothetical protein
MFKRNVSITGFGIGHFINATTGAAVTTGTPTCKRTLDGTGGACANAASYNTDGAVWEIDLAAADMNGDVVVLSFTLTDCLPISYTIRTSTGIADANGNMPSDLNTIKTQAVTAATGVTFPASIGTSTLAAGAKMDLADSLNSTGVADLKSKLGTVPASGNWSTHDAAAVVTALGTGSTLTDCATATGFAVPGSAMALTSGERTTLAAAIEAAIINELDGTAVMQAIADLIASDMTTGDLSVVAIATATRDAILNRVLAGNHDTASTVGLLLQYLDATISSRHASGAAVAKSPATLAAADVTGNLPADVKAWNAGALPTIGTSTLTEANVRTAVGLAAANLDTQLGDIPTVAEFEARTLAAASYFDPATDEVTTDAASRTASKADVTGFALEATLTAMKGSGWTDETLKAIKDAIDLLEAGAAPTAEEIRTEMDANSTKLAEILEDTGTTLPAAIAAAVSAETVNITTESTIVNSR